MTSHTIEVSGRPAELLLVEDNLGDVLLAREAFLGAKIRNNLAVASDGEQALERLRHQGPYTDSTTPDLILLDLNLPRLDGREVLQVIKADPELRRIPVIVFTSSDDELDVDQSYKLSANGYITNPLDFERLKEIVRSLECFWFSVVVLPTPPLL